MRISHLLVEFRARSLNLAKCFKKWVREGEIVVKRGVKGRKMPLKKQKKQKYVL